MKRGPAVDNTAVAAVRRRDAVHGVDFRQPLRRYRVRRPPPRWACRYVGAQGPRVGAGSVWDAEDGIVRDERPDGQRRGPSTNRPYATTSASSLSTTLKTTFCILLAPKTEHRRQPNEQRQQRSRDGGQDGQDERGGQQHAGDRPRISSTPMAVSAGAGTPASTPCRRGRHAGWRAWIRQRLIRPRSPATNASMVGFSGGSQGPSDCRRCR
jgi:hypothetical protein